MAYYTFTNSLKAFGKSCLDFLRSHDISMFPIISVHHAIYQYFSQKQNYPETIHLTGPGIKRHHGHYSCVRNTTNISENAEGTHGCEEVRSYP